MREENTLQAFYPLFEELDRLAGLDVRLGGGWGIDVVAGRVTRAHHDIDLFIPCGQLADAVARFRRAGFDLVMDAPETRVVLESPEGRRLDLNGLAYRPDGHAVQADSEGDIEVFPGWGWTRCQVGDRTVVCLAAEAQRFKHRGYPPRPVDGADLHVIASITAPAGFDPSVRLMEPGEGDLIAGIETASDRLLDSFGLWPLPASAPHAKMAEETRTFATLVAGRPPVGFARLEEVDSHAHIGQLSVLPEYGGLGLGRSLVEAGCRLAEERGSRLITLTTFADVPFNAPWYRRLGFEDLDEPSGPELAQVVADEADLTEYGKRVAMGRLLGTGG